MASKAPRVRNKRGANGDGNSRTPKRRDREVIDAAAEVFYRRGYADASVQDIADELGILKGSLYHYIDTKEDLLFRLLSETHDDVHAILDEVAAVEGLDPLERLHLYVRRQVEFNVDNLTKISVYYHDVERLSDDRRAEIHARRREHERWVVGLITEAQEQGLADPNVDPKFLSRCIFATIIWPYQWFRPGRDKRSDVAETCAHFVLSGVIGNAKR
jgi:TetR/AcrR family transcriptional regulator, cholesterol catabolism regulator